MTVQPTANPTSLNQTAGANPAGGVKAGPAAAAYRSAAAENSHYDKRDLNQDGYVSYLEKMQYAREHPSAVDQAGQGYNPQGQITNSPSARLINTVV